MHGRHVRQAPRSHLGGDRHGIVSCADGARTALHACWLRLVVAHVFEHGHALLELLRAHGVGEARFGFQRVLHLGVERVLLGHRFDLLPRRLLRRRGRLQLLLLVVVLCGAVVEELRVHLHKELHHVAGEAVDGRVPVGARVGVERVEYDGENGVALLRDERDDVLVVPQEERALGHLEVGAAYAARHLLEKARHHLCELWELNHLQDLLDLVQEEHLLGRVRARPEVEDGLEDRVGKLGVLFDELRHAVGELLVVHAHEAHLVERQQGLEEELLVLVLERQRKAVDDRAKDLEEFGDAVMPLRLVDEAVEDVVDGLSDKGAVRHELAVDAVEDGLEVVAFARVLRVEEVQQLHQKLRVDVLLDHLRVSLIGHDEAQQKLIDVLQVRPRGLEHRLVLLRVVLHVRWLAARRKPPEEVG
mmetsp:Transcript_26440/g.55551  ORF Transcript_26440/g.55551 Transcript_26440/m.55551 type:complete len:418 (-) Transcript_26440:520-1773(-)